jgi:hypothetical protein
VGLSAPQQAWGQSECSLPTLQGTYMGFQALSGENLR